MKFPALYAWVTVVEGAKPSVIGTYVPQMNSHMALVGFNRETIERFRQLAENHGKALGQPVAFVKFDGAEVIFESKAN